MFPIPPVAMPRPSLRAIVEVVFTLKRPCQDGTTQAVFGPVDFMVGLAALPHRHGLISIDKLRLI